MLLVFNGEFFMFPLLIEEPIIKIVGVGGTTNGNDWEEEGPFRGNLSRDWTNPARHIAAAC